MAWSRYCEVSRRLIEFVFCIYGEVGLPLSRGYVAVTAGRAVLFLFFLFFFSLLSPPCCCCCCAVMPIFSCLVAVNNRPVGTLKVAVVRGRGLVSPDLNLPGNAYVRVSYMVPDRYSNNNSSACLTLSLFATFPLSSPSRGSFVCLCFVVHCAPPTGFLSHPPTQPCYLVFGWIQACFCRQNQKAKISKEQATLFLLQYRPCSYYFCLPQPSQPSLSATTSCACAQLGQGSLSSPQEK